MVSLTEMAKVLVTMITAATYYNRTAIRVIAVAPTVISTRKASAEYCVSGVTRTQGR